MREIALVVREVMDELGLASYPKTSGATGCTSSRRSGPSCRFPEVRRFAKALAEEVERRVGDQTRRDDDLARRRPRSASSSTSARTPATARSPRAYSVRPTPDARVSAPLEWDEVPDVDPAAFTLETMRERIAKAGDPMRGMWRRRPSLRPRFAALGLEPPVTLTERVA